MFRIMVGDKDINDVVAEMHAEIYGDNKKKSGVIKIIADNLEKNIGNLEEIGEIVERLRVEYPKISNDLKAISAQIDANIEIVNSVATVSQQIGNISKLLDNHIYWSKALGRMENLLSPQIQIDSLSGNVMSGEISLKAFSPSYTIIARQIASFVSDPFIKDVSIGEITTQTSGRLEFSMMLKVNSSEFFKYNQ